MKRMEWALIDPTGVNGACPLICVCMPSVCGSSKVSNCYFSINVQSGYCCSRYIYQLIHRGATAGLILSLTTDNMYIFMFPGFWMWYTMIHMQELLMAASVASVNSWSM